MGIKGAYSFLSNEPSRFGRPWILNSIIPPNHHAGKEANVEIYIDAPALHYHLIGSWMNEYQNLDRSSTTTVHSSDGSTTCRRMGLPIDAPSGSDTTFFDSPTICSPTQLYDLTYTFLLTLYQTGASNIHLVWDGVASPHKREAQVRRLDEQCRRCAFVSKWFTQPSSSSDPKTKVVGKVAVPHLWWESIMQEAVFDLQEKVQTDENLEGRGTSVFVNHFAQGEAEFYLAKEFQHRMNDMEICSIVLFSNDTDLLVYTSIPGFIPLSTLSFETTHTGVSRVMGWEYTQKQFFAAFSFLQSDTNGDVLTNDRMVTVAALAGCDYSLSALFDSHIRNARDIIVGSAVGGLRQRNKHCGTASKNTFIAVVRFVGYICKKPCSDNEFVMKALAREIKKLQNGSQTKKSAHWPTSKLEVANNEETPVPLLDALRIMRDIYEERWNNKELSLVVDRLPRKNVSLRRIIYQQVLYCKPLVEVHSRRVALHSEALKYSSAVETHQLASGSVWMEPIFVQCRLRLYAALSSELKLVHHQDYNHFLEYVHVQPSQHECYHEISVQVTECHRKCFETHSFGAVTKGRKVLEYILGTSSLNDDLNMWKHKTIPYLSRLLLNSFQDNLFLFLLVCTSAPDGWAERCSSSNADLSGDDRANFLQTYNRVQVALFHIHLVYSVGNLFDAEMPNEAYNRNSFHLLFNEACMFRLWKIVKEFVTDVEPGVLKRDLLINSKLEKLSISLSNDSITQSNLKSVWDKWFDTTNT